MNLIVITTIYFFGMIMKRLWWELIEWVWVADIYKNHGIDGFYLQDLFRFEPELYGMMSESIEMGRAYIVKEYQQKPMPLFLLWKRYCSHHLTLSRA